MKRLTEYTRFHGSMLPVLKTGIGMQRLKGSHSSKISWATITTFPACGSWCMLTSREDAWCCRASLGILCGVRTFSG